MADSMKWPEIKVFGTVTISPAGIVHAEGFEFDNAGSCRSASQLAMAWAVEKIGAALVDDMTAQRPSLSALD